MPSNNLDPTKADEEKDTVEDEIPATQPRGRKKRRTVKEKGTEGDDDVVPADEQHGPTAAKSKAAKAKAASSAKKPATSEGRGAKGSKDGTMKRPAASRTLRGKANKDGEKPEEKTPEDVDTTAPEEKEPQEDDDIFMAELEQELAEVEAEQLQQNKRRRKQPIVDANVCAHLAPKQSIATAAIEDVETQPAELPEPEMKQPEMKQPEEPKKSETLKPPGQQPQPRLEEPVIQPPSGGQGDDTSGAQQQHLPELPKGLDPAATAPEVAPTQVASLDQASQQTGWFLGCKNLSAYR